MEAILEKGTSKSESWIVADDTDFADFIVNPIIILHQRIARNEMEGDFTGKNVKVLTRLIEPQGKLEICLKI